MQIKYFDIEKLKNGELEIDKDSQYVALWIGREGDSLSSDIRFVHKNPNLTANILIKAILFDNSKFDMKGNLVIETGAKYTDSYLKIDVLLMNKRAEARAIPSLEITEDDVKGGHGASIGPVDKEQLFYLQMRGFDRELAEKILAEGFVQDAIDHFQDNIPVEMEKQLQKLKK